jgi:hypothetical protein
MSNETIKEELEETGWPTGIPAPLVQNVNCSDCRYNSLRELCEGCEESSLKCKFGHCEECGDRIFCHMSCFDCDREQVCLECFDGFDCYRCETTFGFECRTLRTNANDGTLGIFAELAVSRATILLLARNAMASSGMAAGNHTFVGLVEISSVVIARSHSSAQCANINFVMIAKIRLSAPSVVTLTFVAVVTVQQIISDVATRLCGVRRFAKGLWCERMKYGVGGHAAARMVKFHN